MNALSKLAAQTEHLAAGFATMPFTTVEAVVKVVEVSILAQIGQDAPRRRIAGGSVGVQDRTLRRGPNPAVMVKAKGPLHLLANPTKPHTIETRRASGSRRQASGALALRTPYGPRYTVQHPGTRGKDTWHKGVDKARPLVGVTMQRAVEAEVRKVFP